MSRGALKELIGATLTQFTLLVKDVPKSERRQIDKVFKKYVAVLGNLK